MADSLDYPRIRSVDAFPAEVSGQKVICLRDPLGLSGKVLFFPYPTFFLISLFDGNHSLLDIQAEFMRRFGELLYREKIRDLVLQLDEHFLLESERFRDAQRKMIEDFKRSPLRPLNLADGAYEGTAEKLKETIASYFLDPEGPGPPSAHAGSLSLAGVIAPHIDYRRGGPCYAWAHKAILEASRADLFVILGTSHSAMKDAFALTRKHFQTPWGPVETDQEFMTALDRELSGNFYQDEFAHKGEHSIELQLVFLRALWPGTESFRIVPILCGSFHEAIELDKSPMEIPGVASMIQALKRGIAGTNRRVCVLASADLAHVGPRFGDPTPPDRISLLTLAEEDRRLLGYAERMDGEGFFRILAREKDRRKVCGLSPIYVLLHLLGGARGKLLKYSQSLDPTTQSVVTFCSLAYYS
ncbi:MAG: AmmeMemoRadiSam system protein B [Syntrophaceae bacterium]|nr:AmmeMemoRadiSam system protein B [Syntrophaceae bacterium]